MSPNFRQHHRAQRLALWLATATAASAGTSVVVPGWKLPPAYGDDYPSHIEFGIGGVDISGDHGAFSGNTGIYDGVTGGINDLRLYKEVGEDANELTVDLRALGGLDTVELDVNYEKFEEWYVAGGMRQYREFYDASGGFFPPLSTWLETAEDTHSLDWGKIWIEFGTLSEERPQFMGRFTHHYRNGEKDSTSWGVGGPRFIAPSFRDIDETRDVLELELSRDTGERRWGIGGRFEHSETDNVFNATVGAGAEAQQERIKTDTYSGHSYISQKLNDKLTVSIGASALTADSNLGGARIVGNGSAFVNLRGDSDLNRYNLDANLAYQWTKHLSSVLSLGAEEEELEGNSAKNNGLGPNANEVDEEETFVKAALETRYTGIKRTTLYVLGEVSDGDGETEENGNGYNIRTDSDPSTLKLSTGARWQAMSNLSLSAEYFYREHKDRYDHTRLDAAFGAYPGFIEALDYETNDFNIRATWRPYSSLTLVSRVDYRVSEVRTRHRGLAEEQDADLENVGLSQSASWMVRPGLFLQGSVHYTMDTQDNGSNDLGGALTDVVLETENDFWNLNLNVFAILDEKTDLEASYDYYRADNYTDNSAVSLPFGVGDEEHRFNLTLSRQLSERVRGILRYGYFKGEGETSGGNNDYEAHLVYASLRYIF